MSERWWRESWPARRLATLFAPQARPMQPELEVLSVYRDYGVVPKASRTDNYNRTPDGAKSYQAVRAGDLVVNRMKAWQGSLGVSAFEGLVSPDYEVLAPTTSDLDPRFAHVLLRSAPMIDEYGIRSTGIRPSQWRLYWEQMRTITIPVPLLAEQRAIADYLDRETARIDTLIEEQQRLIEMLHDRRQAAVEEAVSIVATSGARLKHVIRSVRQGWSPQCYSWSADGVDTWAVLKAGAANGGRFRPMENKELPEDEIPRPDIVVTRRDLIVSRANTRELVGSAAVVDGDYPRLMLCDKLYAFSLDESRADSRFVAAVLGSRRWRDLIELEATGASHSMLNVSQAEIVNLPMPLPSVDEQRRIIAHLDSETARIDQLIAETERFIELAHERRSTLITAAVTGQIDVRGVA